jgi:hypothetical protein
MPFETYRTHVPSWATSLEAVSYSDKQEEESFELLFEETPQFLLAVLSLPNGQRPPWLNATLRINTSDSPEHSRRGTEPVDDERTFMDPGQTLWILNSADVRQLQITVTKSNTPVALNVMAFHPQEDVRAVVAGSRIYNLLRLSFGGPSNFKCKACKMTTKALALTIVAAGTLPALPAALISAVAAYLGVVSLLAAQFISSVIGDTVDMIAEKLCKMVGLCP